MDALTGLCNRRHFHELAERRLEEARRSGHPAALCFVDLDNFKGLNDSAGHAQGDAALKEVARILKSDSRPHDVIARLGGDEFALWLEGADEAGATARAKRLFERVVELLPLVIEGGKPLGFSIGIAVYAPGSDETVDGLVARADDAMYAVKRAGKGHFVVAAPASGENISP
jgi:diguanylate cyclase (GGDEF)-like protein